MHQFWGLKDKVSNYDFENDKNMMMMMTLDSNH